MTIQPVSQPEEQPEEQSRQPGAHIEELPLPGMVLSLVGFGIFFIGSVLLIPAGIFRFMQVFNPQLRFTDLSAVEQVLIQAILNVTLVGFIYILVRVVYREPFRQFIHWFRNETLSVGHLVMFGASMALTVLVVSSFFPPAEPPPIETLLSNMTALWVFALFGVGVAPLFEEIIFRGFLFKVLAGLGGPRVAVKGTAVLFALLHIPQLWGSWAGIALIFGVGYVLSQARDRSNSLIPSFIMHTAYNATLFTLFALSSLVEKDGG